MGKKNLTGRRATAWLERLRVESLSRAALQYVLWRELRGGLVVHHVNGDRLDDRLDNYQVLTLREHASLHRGPALGIVFCPGCWSLFLEARGDERRLFCSQGCGLASVGRPMSPGRRLGEYPQEQRLAWAEASFLAYLAGEAAPPPRLRYWPAGGTLPPERGCPQPQPVRQQAGLRTLGRHGTTGAAAAGDSRAPASSRKLRTMAVSRKGPP